MWDRPQLVIWVANLLYALATLALLYTVLFVAVHMPIFPFRQIDVTGDLNHVTRQQVEYIVRNELKGNFFTLDLNQARQAFEKLPWARSVNVRRRWPDRLEVTLEEHVALARWGNVALVNTKGELFEAASDANLPVFAGPNDSEKEIARRYAQFMQELQPTGLKPQQVILTPRLAWQLKLNNGLIVEIGREHVEERLARFASVYKQSLEPLGNRIQAVDLRYPNGFAVRVPGMTKPAELRQAA